MLFFFTVSCGKEVAGVGIGTDPEFDKTSVFKTSVFDQSDRHFHLPT